MTVKRNLFLLFFALIVLSFLNTETAFSQAQEYKEYTVKKGDTLWEIANKEIVDPFLWPKIWKENPRIKNPDLLYPGQKIRIPLYLIQKEVPPKPVEKAMPSPEVKPPAKEEPKAEKIKPVEKKYLIDMDTLISSGYISSSLESKGTVIGSPTGRSVLNKDDFAYIETVNPVNTGDKFYILRSAGKVFHPETGDFMGYLIEVMGIAEVVEKRTDIVKARITQSFQEVAVGDLLDNFYEIEPAFETDNPKSPNIAGYIVATRQRRTANGQMDIVYIDKGSKDGLSAGDILRTILANKFSSETNSVIQVINTKESTATAIIRKSEKEVIPKDKIKG